MKERIRIKSVGIGQVDSNLAKKYQETFGYGKLHILSKVILEKNILGRRMERKKDNQEDDFDLNYINEVVKKMYYNNPGEYIEDYMRAQLIKHSEDEELKLMYSKNDLLAAE